MWGQDVTVTFNSSSDVGTGTSASGKNSVAKEGITISCTAGGFAISGGAHYRLASGSTTTISSTVGHIKSIVITGPSGTGSNSISKFGTNSGWTLNSTSGTYTWSGDAESVSVKANSGQVRPTSIAVTYTPTSSGLTTSDLAITGAPVALNFDLYNNNSAQTVTYSTSSTGAVTVTGGTGYVTTSLNSGTKTITVTPTAVTPSTQTITVSQEADATYAAGSKTFTVTVTDSSPISNIAALTAKSAGNYTVSLTDALVTYVHGNNAYLEDASGAVLLYGCKGDLAVGDKITGTANVTYTVYNNLPEVTAFTLQTGYTKTSGNTVTPTEVTIATLESNYTSYLSRYVKIVGATVTSAFSSKNSTIEQSGSSIVLRDQNSSATLTTTVNDIVTVTAHPSIYNSTHQIAVYEQGQIVVAKVNPTITFNNGSVRVGNTLDLSTLFTSNSTGAVTYSITAGGSYATLSGSTLTATAEGSVTVKAEQAESSSYNAGEATATITVNPALVLSSIAVTTAPTKTTYNEGETFDPTGMVVTATYTDNTTEAVTGYTYSPNGALTTSDTEVTISYTESGVTRTTTQAITVNEVVDYATLPFTYTSGKDDIANTTGLTQDGLGSDYNDANALLKFDNTGDYLVLKIHENPGTLTFNIKNNGFSGGTFTVEESEDGSTYSPLKEYKSITSTQEEELTPASTTRYIRWIYTSKSSGNVGIGNIALAAYVAPSSDPSISAEDVNIAYNATSGEIVYTISNPTEATLTAALTDGDWISNVAVDAVNSKVTFDATANEGNTDRTATITLSYIGATDKIVTITQAKYVAPFQATTWTLATTITSGKHYIITNGSNKAMGVQNGNNRSAADVSTVNNVVTVANSDVREFVIYGPDADGYYSIYDETEGGYLYAASSGSNHLKTQETNNDNGRWTISFGNDDQAVITAQGANSHNLMRYNENSKLFSCYTTGQFAIYLNEKSGEATPTQAVTVSNASYATFCSENALDFSDSSIKAYTASVAGNITFTRVLKVPANTGVLLYADGGANESVPALTGTAGDVSGNLFVAATTEIASLASESDGKNNYILNNGEDGIGFYLANNKKVGAGKAYLAVPKSGGVRSFVALPGGINTGIQTSDNLTIGQSDNCYDLQGRRISTPKNGLYIVNGKKVLVK